MKSSYGKFGAVVRAEREHHGWTQEVFAERANLNRSYVGEIERGDVVPSLDTLAKLSKALDVRLSELIRRCEHDSRV